MLFVLFFAISACVLPNSHVAAVNVSVMLPLDAVTSSGLTNPNKLYSELQTLANAGITGVMVDVWWGICERSPRQYNFTAYVQLANMLQRLRLRMQPIMSFHRCGGNVGDTCDIPVPAWVQAAAQQQPAMWYTDREGNADTEYVSLFADEQALWDGRTAVQLYADYMSSFASALKDYFGNTIFVVQIGLGPAGELRYPSYPLNHWHFCGVGEFQSYGSLALASLAAAAAAAGHPEWGHGGPNDAGSYNDYPDSTGFFSAHFDQRDTTHKQHKAHAHDNTHIHAHAHAHVHSPHNATTPGDNYQSAYGQFFLDWYSEQLKQHGVRVLSRAADIFPKSIKVSAKVPGIHWWYKHPSHAAELTAGLYNTNNRDAYADLAKAFAGVGAGMDFTCLEMLDSEQPASCDCAPFELVQQAKAAAHASGIRFAGENALARYDQTAYNTIKQQAFALGYAIDGFTYLRLDDTLMQSGNLATFTSFVRSVQTP
eukprot:m.143837 g.143837  ORF g.143837 m.143837 type:complete len:483 (-) comp14996_c0_seq6:192-1640(-)